MLCSESLSKEESIYRFIKIDTFFLKTRLNVVLTLWQEMGTDPICFVGWENSVKWHFFLPVLVGAGVSIC